MLKIKTMKRIFFTSIAAMSLLLVLQSCTTAIIDEGSVDTLPPINRTVTYQSDVATIMFNNCLTCHSGNAPSDGLDLSTYANVRFAAEQRNLIQRMNDATNPMPQNGLLSPEIRQIMDQWIEDGLLEQ